MYSIKSDIFHVNSRNNKYALRVRESCSTLCNDKYHCVCVFTALLHVDTAGFTC